LYTAQKSNSHYAPQPYTNQSVFKSLLNCASEMSPVHFSRPRSSFTRCADVVLCAPARWSVRLSGGTRSNEREGSSCQIPTSTYMCVCIWYCLVTPVIFHYSWTDFSLRPAADAASVLLGVLGGLRWHRGGCDLFPPVLINLNCFSIPVSGDIVHLHCWISVWVGVWSEPCDWYFYLSR